METRNREYDEVWRELPSFAASKFVPDIEAFFGRINVDCPRDPTLATLREIHSQFIRNIPFENLDVQIIRDPPSSIKISLDPRDIERKIVTERRGGYCFELNSLLYYILKALEFNVRPIIARVTWQVPETILTGTTHLVLRVELDGKRWLVDAGFGTMLLTEILDIDIRTEQETRYDYRRIICTQEGRYNHQVRFFGTSEWLNCYTFTQDEIFPIDCEMYNWWTSTYPESKFVKNIIASMVRDDKKYALLNTTLITRHIDGTTTKENFENEEIYAILSTYFNLRIDSQTKFEGLDC